MCVRKIVFTTLLMSSLLVGCTATDDADEGYENEINQLTEEVTELKTVIAAQEDKIDSLENFSYLNDFTEEELKAYDLFLEEYDVTQLKNYSPEKIVLLYLHSLATGDVDTIHAIAYDGGTLTDLDTFRDTFNNPASNVSSHDVVMPYRNYDSIEVREENKSEDSVGVEISVSSGSHTSVIIYEVNKENEQWKIVIQHLFEEI